MGTGGLASQMRKRSGDPSCCGNGFPGAWDFRVQAWGPLATRGSLWSAGLEQVWLPAGDALQGQAMLMWAGSCLAGLPHSCQLQLPGDATIHHAINHQL